MSTNGSFAATCVNSTAAVTSASPAVLRWEIDEDSLRILPKNYPLETYQWVSTIKASEVAKKIQDCVDAIPEAQVIQYECYGEALILVYNAVWIHLRLWRCLQNRTPSPSFVQTESVVVEAYKSPSPSFVQTSLVEYKSFLRVCKKIFDAAAGNTNSHTQVYPPLSSNSPTRDEENVLLQSIQDNPQASVHPSPESGVARAVSHHPKPIYAEIGRYEDDNEWVDILWEDFLESERNVRPGEPKRNVRPGEKDVLCGRGTPGIVHSGNIRFRKEAKRMQPRYLSPGMTKSKKTAMSKDLVMFVEDAGGMFLEKDNNNQWCEVDNFEKKRQKASQALREVK